jgi:hypothetical protein
MEVFFPSFESNITALVGTLSYIVFAIMAVGLIIYAASPRTSEMSLLMPIAKAVLILVAISTMSQWFPVLDTSFLQVADAVDPGYTTNPTAAAESIRSSTDANPSGQSWSWRHLNESLYRAVTDAIAHVFVYVGTLITVPMLILQYVLRWLLYLLTPFALALILVPGFSGISVRFFQQMLAIHAWPVGFAMTNMMALSVWQDFRNAVGPNPQSVSDALYSPLLTFTGALLGAIMIVIGMISTPIVMQMLFTQGQPFTGSSGNPATMFRTATNAIYGVRSLRGATVPLASARLAANPKPSSPPPPPAGADSRPGI